MGQSPPSEHVSEKSESGLAFLQGNAEFSDLYPHPRLRCSKPLKKAKNGDALISVRAPVGAINRADQDYCIGRGLAAIRFIHADPDYGYHALAFVASNLRKVAQGTTFEAVGGKDLRGLEFPDSPPHEQRRIAEILDTLDEAIRKTERVIAKLQQMKQGLLHDLLTRGIDENGELRDPERHPEQFKDSPLGRIPRGWEVKRVNQFSSTYAGGTPSREIATFYGGDIPWVKSGEVNRDEILFTEETITKAALIASSVKWVEPETPLVAMYGATAGVVSWLKIRATTNQAVLAFQVESAISARWLYWALKQATPSLLATIQGSGQPNLSKSVIERVRLLVPCDKREQEAIAHRIDEIHARMRSEDIELNKLRSFKQGLMDDLLTGRVRVAVPEEATA